MNNKKNIKSFYLKLKEARESLLESEEEIMNYYDLTDLAKTKLN